MKRLICFDLDGTLTQHRSALEAENRAILDKLFERYKVVIVGAGSVPRIYEQMNRYPVDIIGNYGMQEGKVVEGELVIIREDTYEPDREYFINTIGYLRKKYGYTDFKGEGVEFHSTGMVTFPLLGTMADIADKIAFDPTREKRKAMYAEVLELFKDHTVYIGGSSSFDFSAKRYNKYDAIMTYASENGYALDEILYVGDDFGDGGGDSHIRIYGMDYIEVKDYNKLEEYLGGYLV